MSETSNHAPGAGVIRRNATVVIANMHDFKNEHFAVYSQCIHEGLQDGRVKHELGLLGNGYWQYRRNGEPVATNIQMFVVLEQYNNSVPDYGKLYDQLK